MTRTMKVDVRDDWDFVEVDYDDDELAAFMARKYGLDEKKMQEFISDQNLEDALIESALDDDDFNEYLAEKFWDGQGSGRGKTYLGERK